MLCAAVITPKVVAHELLINYGGFLLLVAEDQGEADFQGLWFYKGGKVTTGEVGIGVDRDGEDQNNTGKTPDVHND